MVVNPSCNPPTPITDAKFLSNRPRENSNPITNKSRTTPISANSFTEGISEINCSPYGPIKTPAMR